MTDRHWPNPRLSDAAAVGFDGFLPPYNQEMFEIHDGIEARLSNLRQWLDIDGEALNVPLLAAPIDPKRLQRSAKAALTLRSAEYEQQQDQETRLDFSSVARSAKGYVANLKTTSSRLQAAREKGDGARMSRLRRSINREKVVRAAVMQDLVIDVATREVKAKEAQLAGASAILANHVGNVLVDYGLAMAGHLISQTYLMASITVGAVLRKSYRIIGSAKSAVPTIYGMATGGQHLTAPDLLAMIDRLSKVVDAFTLDDSRRESAENNKELVDLTAKLVEYSTQVHTARAELNKAKAALGKERAEQDRHDAELNDADTIIQMGESSFGKPEFYDWLTADLEMLFAEEWPVTQEFCRLLVRIYNEETGEIDGATFLRTTSLGGQYERFNAPYRLALDLERLEAAFVRAALDQEGQSSTLQFMLSELPALGMEISAAEALIVHGEAHFDVTDEMFDTFYPGRYDRRIQGLQIRFPGLAKEGIRPHARLTQIADTRCLTPERDPGRGARFRQDHHALQSIMIGAPQIDTLALEQPNGQLKRFQNTGVASRWHLNFPAVLEQRR